MCEAVQTARRIHGIVVLRRRPFHELPSVARRTSHATFRKIPLPSFISEHIEEITREWEVFARTVSPASANMDGAALRDHVRQMLQAIAIDIQTSQTDREQYLKSKGLAAPTSPLETAAETHGALRYSSGFDLSALVAEFRALRASVLRLALVKGLHRDDEHAYELARFNEAIDQALAESVSTYSEELARSRDTFLAVLGHDLRAPLGALSTAFEILSTATDNASRSDALAAGKQGVATMSATIRDLQEFTRSRLGKGIPVVLASANLETVCKAAISEASFTYPQTTFRFECSGKLEGQFDSARIHQVAANLLNNAVQHGMRGAPITLIASGGPGGLTILVKNRGFISPDFLARIFEPVIQGSSPGADKARSTNMGLGLFIAREIVLAHNGTIDVTSSVAEGTTFKVELPRVGVPAAKPAPAATSASVAS